MALNLFAPNDSGVAALAGMSSPHLDFKPLGTDISGLTKPTLDLMAARYQAQQELAKQQLVNTGNMATTIADNKNRLDVTNLVNTKAQQLQQQSQLFQAQQTAKQQQLIDIPTMQANIANQKGNLAVAQQNAATQQQQAANQAQFQQGSLGVAQQNANTQQELNQASMAMDRVKASMMMTEYQNKQMGTLAAVSATALMNAQTPEQQQQVIQAARQKAIDSGIATKDSIDQMLPSDPQQFLNAAKYGILISGMAKDMMDAGFGVGLTGNLVHTTDDKGNPIPVSSSVPLASKDREDLAKQIADDQNTLGTLKDLQNQYLNGGIGNIDTVYQRLKQNTIGKAGEVLGIPTQSNEDQIARDGWNAQAQLFNVNLASGLPGFKYSARTSNLIKNATLNDHDMPDKKIAVMNGAIKSLTRKIQAAQTMYQTGMSLNSAQQQELNQDYQSDFLGKK